LSVSCKNLASFPKSIVKESQFELVHPKKKRKKDHLVKFWFGSFTISFSTARSLVILWMSVYWWKYTDGHIICSSVLYHVTV